MSPAGVRVFIDASVLLAACASSTGGSSAALALIGGSDRFGAVVSSTVLAEVARNLESPKFSASAALRFHALLAAARPELIEARSPARVPDLPAMVARKDRHVLEACLSAGVSVCLTLDRRHLLAEPVRTWALGVSLRLMSPGEFLVWHRLEEGVGEG